MAKAKQNIRVQRQTKEGALAGFNLEKILPQKYHVAAVIAVIILLYLIFLNPLYFGGKTFQSGDIVSMQSAKSYIDKDRDGFSLWNPYIFCGMPAYATGTEFTWFNLIYTGVTTARNIFSSLFAEDYVKWTFYLILLGITSFLFMRYLTKNTMVSLFTALATAFSTGLIVFLFIGHVTKLTSLCIYPLIFLMLLRMQEKIRLLDFVLLIIALQIFVQGFHVQIIFYTLFSVGVYYIYFFIRSLAKKDRGLTRNLLKSAGVFVAAAGIAVLIQSDNLTQIYEYTPYSTRGTESISEKSKGETPQSESDYYKYHTDWSFSPGEVMTFIVPSFYGFGSSQYKGPLTQEQEVEVYTYFGQMPFVDVAMYMGVIVFFLALFAVFTRWKEPFVQFLVILCGVALILSFGRTFPVLFDLFFYNFPNFNKFRVPSMILVILQVSFPVLAGLGLMRIIELRRDQNAKLNNVVKKLAFVFSGIFILALVLSGPVTSWFQSRAQAAMNQQVQPLAGYAAEMFSTDLILAFLFLALTSWGAHLYINKRLSGDALAALVILLTLVDLWRIDARGASPKYTDSQKETALTAPEYVNVIKNQNDKDPFRILNLKQDRSLGSLNQNANYHTTFLIEDMYGYSGIKPRAYQDILDVAGIAAPGLWSMLNVKYVVMQEAVNFQGLNLVQTTPSGSVYSYAGVLPRVFLVNRVEKKPVMEFLNIFKTAEFNPKDVAYVEDQSITVDVPDSTASVNISKYAEDNLQADVTASGNNFLFFSSTYLPTGWKAAIDGRETGIIKANHGFMGIIVPRGKHKIEFKYAPSSFFITKNISLVLSSLVVIGLIAGIFLNRKKQQAAVAG